MSVKVENSLQKKSNKANKQIKTHALSFFTMLLIAVFLSDH